MDRAQPVHINPRIGILLIATGKYTQFLKQFIGSAEKCFMQGQANLHFFVFTNDNEIYFEISDYVKLPSKITCIEVEHNPWPSSTLKRYEMFTKHADILRTYTDYLFYSDVDMRFIAPVGEEVLSNGLTAVFHPGFYSFEGQGSWGNNLDSSSYTPPELRKKYYAGGFQGGRTNAYLQVASQLSLNITQDLSKGIIAEWHDETHWNCFLAKKGDVLRAKNMLTELTPSYCMVEETHKRINWKIDHLQPKLIALSKNHEELRK